MSNLTKSKLGNTDLTATKLGFGAAEIGGPPLGPELADVDVSRLLNRVLDLGINFIDTSIDYGLSEALIGRHLSHRRMEFAVATKCGCIPGDPGRGHRHTGENIRAGVENSLRLLRTDHIDLVQFHLSLTTEELEDHGALDELKKLKAEGKTRFIGISSTLPLVREHAALGVFDCFQLPYSALERDHEEVISSLREHGYGVIVRGGVSRGAPVDWENRVNFRLTPETAHARWDAAGLDEILGGMSRMEFMLRFTLSHPGIHTAVIGTRNIQHLAENYANAIKGPLPNDILEEAKRRLDLAGSTPQT